MFMPLRYRTHHAVYASSREEFDAWSKSMNLQPGNRRLRYGPFYEAGSVRKNVYWYWQCGQEFRHSSRPEIPPGRFTIIILAGALVAAPADQMKRIHDYWKL